MLRVSRNYQHQDLSRLLTPQQAPAKPKKKKQPPIITPEKRRRDSLMSNRKMRYALSHTGKIHDRDCPHAAQIPDEAFDMCEDFPNGRYVCFVCYRKALVRRGLALDLTKYMDAAMRVFREVGATNSDLNTLFLQHNAQIYRVEANCVHIKVNEDCWIVQIAEGGCMLHHNNYRKINESQRLMEAGFHLQVDKPITFRNALVTMRQYTWDGHIQAVEAKLKAYRQAALRKQLASVCNYRMVDRPSLFFRYFHIAIPQDHSETLPCRVIKRDACETCDLLLCRLPRWKVKSIPGIAESVKAYCVTNECHDYEQSCSQVFSRGT